MWITWWGQLNSEDSLLEYYFDANRELSYANMPLREWSSNAKGLQYQIDQDQKGAQTVLSQPIRSPMECRRGYIGITSCAIYLKFGATSNETYPFI